jgi:peptide/nickel transport system substrate-binding protein
VTVVSEKDNTIRIESERPTHVMDAVLAEWVFVIYLNNSDNDDNDNDTNNFIYTGPYMVTKFDAEDDRSRNSIELAPNRHYDDRSFERPLITIQKYADGHALAKGLENNELDIGFHLPVDTLSGLREIAENVNIKSFEVGYHYMMFYNTDDDSTMSDITVRQAVDLVLDRTELSQALRGGTATRSLFPDYSPYYFDESEIQHGQDDRAGELLDQAGYTMNPDTGKRENTDGEELTV